MTRRRWLLLVVACGVAILALSLVSGWVVHDRELRGEGYRHVQIALSAWRGRAVPIVSGVAVAALATAAWATVMALRPALPSWPLVAGSVLAVAAALAVAVPVGQDSHASSVTLSPGPLLPPVVALAAGLLVGTVAVAWPARRPPILLGVAVIVLAAGLAGGRWLVLQAGEGSGRHWSEGAYTRAATGAEPTETLVIGDGTFSIATRWSGRWEWSGWTVVVDGDPACPDSRGTYHAHGEGEEDLRFVAVVDTCAGGARAADLETGIWTRDP